VNEYFRDQDKDDKVLDKQEARASIQIGYRAVLDSKSNDETLVSNLFTVLLYIYFNFLCLEIDHMHICYLIN
jgi:hypothetical protein